MVKLYTASFIALIGLKFCAAYFTSFSMYGDEAQYWLWSQSLDFGYFSKPPLLAWFLSAHIKLFGDSFFSLKTFPLLIYFLIGFSLFRLCLQLGLSKSNATVCSLSFLTVPAASISSFLVSTDLLLMFFWILGMTRVLALRQVPSLKNFVLLAVYLGLSFLAKYAAVYFLLSFLILIVFDNKMLRALNNNLAGCLLFVLVLIMILMPNIYWNVKNEWLTLSHTADNANLQNLNLNFYGPLKFLITQIFMLGPVLFISFFYIFRSFSFDFENKFLLIYSLPIFFIVIIESFLVRANANWAAPALISLFLLFFRLMEEKKQSLVVVNFVVNYLIGVFLFVSILISFDIKIFDRVRGVDNFVKDIVEIVGDKDIAVTDRIIFSSMSYEMRNAPNTIFMPYKNGESITNHFQIVSPLSQKRQVDFYLIGSKNDVSYLLKENEIEQLKEFDVPFSSSKLKLYEVIFK